MPDYIYPLDLMGTAVFALSGILVAEEVRLDLFGAVVLATVTGIGGGTIRDLLIGASPVFWVQDPVYLYVILATAVLSYLSLSTRLMMRMPWLLPVADACGLALFTAIGARKALDYQVHESVAVIMGVMTGVAGGIIRDMLANRVPLVLQREFYAMASVLGGILLMVLLRLGTSDFVATLLAMVLVLLLRLAAIRWHLSLPIIKPRRGS